MHSYVSDGLNDRLVQFVIPVPPLRERGTDVLLLADRFLADTTTRHADLGTRHFTPSARRALLRYGWPGNVRELKSAVERAALAQPHNCAASIARSSNAASGGVSRMW